MKKNFLKFLVTVVAMFFVAIGCEKPMVDPVDLAEIQAQVAEELLSATSATFDVEVKHATTLYYTSVVKGEDINADDLTWESKAIEEDGTIKVTISDLAPETEYIAGFYAENIEGTITAVQAVEFKTTADMSPKVVEIEVVEETTNSAILNVSAINATTIEYSYYVKDTRPEIVEYVSVELIDGVAKVEINDLPISTESRTLYTLVAVAVNADNVKSEESSRNFQTIVAEKVLATDLTVNASVSSVSASVVVENATKVIWSLFAAANSEKTGDAIATAEITEVVYGADAETAFVNFDVTGWDFESEYVLEVVAVNEGVTSEVLSSSFTTPVEPAIKVSNIKGTPFSITFDVEVTEGYSGFAYLVYTREYFESEMLDRDLKEELLWAQDVGTGSGSYNSGQMLLETSTEHVIIIAAATYEEGGFGPEIMSIDSDPTIYYGSTEFSFGGNPDATVAFEVTDTYATSLVLHVSAKDQNEVTETAFAGAVPKKDIGSTPIEEYLLANTELISRLQPTQVGGVNYWDEPIQGANIIVGGLLEGTEYVVFVYGCDANYNIGNVVTMDVSTSAITFDDNISVDVEFVPDLREATMNITYNGNATKFYQVQRLKGEYSEEEAFDYLYNETTSEYSTPITETSHKYEWLEMGTDYEVYILPVDDNGNMGHLQHYEFSTKSPSLESDASIELELVSVTAEEDEWGYTSYSAVYNVNMKNGAVSYLYGTVPDELPNSGNDLACAMNLLNIDSGYEGSDLTFTYVFYSTTDYLVFIPKDIDGNMGTPVVSRDWADGLDTGGGEGGGTPEPRNK